LDLARTLGEAEIEIHAANNVGTALAFGGGGGGEAGPHTAEGRDLLHRSLALAIALDRPEHAARAYTNLGSGAVKTRCHAEGERVLRSGIAYCTDRDLDSWRLYMSAWLARTLCEQGRLGEASRVAAEVLATPQLSTISFLSAAPAVLADLRRGLPAGGVLHRAVALARATGEPQRVVPIAAARAEAAWLAGRLVEAGDELTAAWEATHTHADGWHAGELAWWLRLAGVRLPDLRPASLPAPLAALLGGDWSAAADAWLALGCPLWAAQALNRSHRLEDARRALQLADDCGAIAVVDALRRDRRAAGLIVPRGPRPSSQANPAALTTREIEVLRLLGDGHSNADIATALVLSAKTVGHHVSAVLRKLDEPTRARAAAAARQRGIL
jgi:DNA-binding CsgD family transcriptional regulator